jgi:hypothetical protein
MRDTNVSQGYAASIFRMEMNMEAAQTSETLASYNTVRRHNPEDGGKMDV